MGIINITRAVRKGSHVLIALYGESGSGKTYSGLLLARGIAGSKGRVVMIDTETGRGLVYADEIAGGYEYGELTPPFTPERYIEAISEAEKAGADVLVLDSASHEWEGIGGVIEMADEGKSNEGKPLQGLIKWAKPKARHKKFVQALLATRMHIIVCLRAKEKMIQKVGSKEIVSGGFVSVQDKRFIFETTVQLFMHNGNGKRGSYTIEKCPQGLLGAFSEGQKITLDTGKHIAEWVGGAQPVDHAFEALKRAGEAAAEQGTEAFTSWWNGASVKPHRTALRNHLDNFKSIATAADNDARGATEPAHDPETGEVEDPFSSREPAPAQAPAAEPAAIRHVGEPAKPAAEPAKAAPAADPKAPPSPLSLAGKAREAAWPAFTAWLAREVESRPKAEREAFLKSHGKEWAFVAENRPGDVDKIAAALDAPEPQAPAQAAE